MRAATRKVGHWTKRSLIAPPLAQVHRFEMIRRRVMREHTAAALLEMRAEYMRTLGAMIVDGEMEADEAVGLSDQLEFMPLWREQQRHGTTGKLIPLRKEFPDGVG